MNKATFINNIQNSKSYMLKKKYISDSSDSSDSSDNDMTNLKLFNEQTLSKHDNDLEIKSKQNNTYISDSDSEIEYTTENIQDECKIDAYYLKLAEPNFVNKLKDFAQNIGKSRNFFFKKTNNNYCFNLDYSIFTNNKFIKDSAIYFNNSVELINSTDSTPYSLNALSNIIVNEHNILNVFAKQKNIRVLYDNDNVYNIDLIIPPEYFSENVKLQQILTQKQLVVNIKIDSKFYPFIQPKITIKNPQFCNSIITQINSLPVFKEWSPFLNITSVIVELKNFLINLENIIVSDITDKDEIYLIEELNTFISFVNNYAHLIKKQQVNNSKSTNESCSKGDFARGTGYSSHKKICNNNGVKLVDIIESKNRKISKCLLNITRLLALMLINKPDYDVTYLYKNYEFIDYICTALKELTLSEIINESGIFPNILNFLRMTLDVFCILINNNNEIAISLRDSLQHIYNDCISYQTIIKKVNKSDNDIRGVVNFINFYEKLLLQLQTDIIQKNKQLLDLSDNDKYIQLLKNEHFREVNTIPIAEKFYLSKNAIVKISKEYIILKNSLPLNVDASIFFTFSEQNISHSQFIITGPPNTPYDSGCFLFDMQCSKNYPDISPTVKLLTTGSGAIRFNPNLYESGKVCLSLLGTWSSTSDEQWIPDKSTLLQVLVSILGLIFVDEPYFNEPGYQQTIGTDSGNVKSNKYNQGIRYNCLKYAIHDQLVNPKVGFENVINNHFKLKAQYIKHNCKKWLDEYDNSMSITKDCYTLLYNDVCNKLDLLQ